MTITKIIGEDGVRQSLCNGGGCPQVILTKDGHAIVQGSRLSTLESEAIPAPEHETQIKLPVALLQQMVANI